MQGINRSKHRQLVATLTQLQELLRRDSVLPLISAHLEELEETYRNYEKALTDLAVLIEEYEDLHHQVKVKYLGRKLKTLKDEIVYC